MRILLANFAKMVGDTGGAAKVQCNFANEMKQRGHIVQMMYIDAKIGKTFYPVNDGIEVVNLQHYNGHDILFPAWMRLKRELLRPIDIRRARAVNNEFVERFLLGQVRVALQSFHPDIIVAWQPAASKCFLLDLNTQIPVITMSHGDTEDFFHTYPVKEIPAIPKSTVFQVLLPSFRESLIKRYPDLQVKVISNIVPQYQAQANLATVKAQYKILYVGRLNRSRKRPHLLIEAFAQIAQDFPNWIVELWGAQEHKTYTAEMCRYIKSHNLQDRILFKGTTSNIAQQLLNGDLFVMPSAAEGFSLAQTEAMSAGLPVIGFKHAVSVNELIQDGKNGLLAEDSAAALAKAMRQLMDSQELRVKMGQAARKSMKQYTAQAIWDTWERLLSDTVKGQ